MKKTNKIIISLSSIISISSMPLIAAIMSKQESNSYKSIINNITPQKTIDNQKQQEDKSKEEKPNGSGNSSPRYLPHKLKIIKTHQWMIILKKKNKMMTLMVLVILLQILTPQIQDNQNHQWR
ncbi:variable surface lipoprotein [Mycoplasmopsis bovis]|nr:variable surface lipoprotein [Mycoplasmopsis bovis]QQH72326.1 variable surface lipoprotein [Mycoplasmopsis bovis]